MRESGVEIQSWPVLNCSCWRNAQYIVDARRWVAAKLIRGVVQVHGRAVVDIDSQEGEAGLGIRMRLDANILSIRCQTVKLRLRDDVINQTILSLTLAHHRKFQFVANKIVTAALQLLAGCWPSAVTANHTT